MVPIIFSPLFAFPSLWQLSDISLSSTQKLQFLRHGKKHMGKAVLSTRMPVPEKKMWHVNSIPLRGREPFGCNVKKLLLYILSIIYRTPNPPLMQVSSFSFRGSNPFRRWKCNIENRIPTNTNTARTRRTPPGACWLLFLSLSSFSAVSFYFFCIFHRSFPNCLPRDSAKL